jgi:hypothetical protein
MANLVVENLSDYPQNVNLGSAAGVIHQFPLVFSAFIADFYEILTGVDTYYKEGQNFQIMLAYAQEMWQRTAAKAQGNNFSLNSGLKEAGHLDLTGAEIVSAQIDITSYPLSGTRIGDSPALIRGGWIRFRYGTLNGRLQKITFEHQIFYPETIGSDGFDYSFDDGIVATVNLITKDFAGVPLVPQAGSPLLVARDEWSGYEAPGGNVGAVAGQQLIDVVVPAQDTFFVQTTHTIPNWMYTIDSITNFTNYSWHIALLAYLCEAWQILCAPDASEASGATHVCNGGTNFFVGDFAYVVSSDLEITLSPGGSDLDFGNSGFPYYGWYAAVHGAYVGPQHFINANQNWLVPTWPDATGWVVYLKQGVQGVLNVYGKTQRCQGLSAPAGTISFADGDHAGLNL